MALSSTKTQHIVFFVRHFYLSAQHVVVILSYNKWRLSMLRLDNRAFGAKKNKGHCHG